MSLFRAAFLTAAAALAAACSSSTLLEPSWTPTTRETAFLDTVQQRTFAWFWEQTDPVKGLTPDRWPTPSFSSVAAVGFALTAYPIGAERGYISRAEARDRVLATIEFFWTAPQGPEPSGVAGHKGFFYHFLDIESGHRFQQVELSTIDTSLLLAGMLFCQSYFDRDEPAERRIRELADSIYRRVEWDWIQPRAPLVSMGWKPEEGFLPYDWTGFNEAMLLYVLALGSPTHPIDVTAWGAWTRSYRWGEYYGYEHVGFAPLFGHHYSHLWVDFRGIQDSYMRGRGIDYFENAERATRAQRAYAMDNPMQWRDYGELIWGLTASDGPVDREMDVNGTSRRFFTYAARGASFTEVRDDGTIAPTAAGGSVPFAPDITIPALIEMRERYGDALFTRYGFLDSFNPTFVFDVPLQHGRVLPELGWVNGDHLGIDQGPILGMIENYRTDLVWDVMQTNPHVVRGLCRAGFAGGWLAGRCD
jgi:hypothetical protein